MVFWLGKATKFSRSIVPQARSSLQRAWRQRLAIKLIEVHPANGATESFSPIRQIFKEAFAAAALAYFNPHSFRKTLALLGGRICRTPEEYKAWSQNLGHDHVMTTFSSYGDVGSYRQAEIIRGFSEWGDGSRQAP